MDPSSAHFIFLEPGRSLQDAIQGRFEPTLVILSVFVACIAAYTAFLFSERINSSRQQWQKLAWLGAGSFSLGVGIWAMHFTGMIAYHLPFAVAYDKSITLISIIPVVLASAVVFMASIFRVPYWWCLPMQSILMGSGIGAMHYIGMAAMQMDAQMRYAPFIFALSIVVAVVLSYVSLRLKLWAESYQQDSETRTLLIAAFCMGLAISTMHYTGMAAVYYFPVHADVTMLDAGSSWVPESITNIVMYTVLIMLSLMIGAVHLSRRLELLRQLENSETRQSNIVDNMVDGLIVIDQWGVIDCFNPAAEDMFGYAITEVLGNNVNMLMSGQDREQHDGYMSRYHSQQKSDVIGIGRDILARHKDGRVFPIELALSKFKIDGEIFFSGVVRDISERKEAEKNIIEARRIAEVASHAKSEFLNRVSHELRTPMNAIMGFGQLLEEDSDQFEDEHRTYLRELKLASQRLLKLIDSMLDLSSIETHKLDVSMDAVLLFDVIHACVTEMLPQAQASGITLQNMLNDHDLIVMADIGRLQQVLHHLLSNAIKHNKPDGHVSIGCERLADHRVRISITDTGEGLTDQQKTELFTPFDRLHKDERLQGTGLGLVISKHLLELMGGSIGVESKPGVGSTFWLELACPSANEMGTNQTPVQH